MASTKTAAKRPTRQAKPATPTWPRSAVHDADPFALLADTTARELSAVEELYA
ncbi:MAG: hypothetical protein FWJ65_11065 [Limnochordales bacterium]